MTADLPHVRAILETASLRRYNHNDSRYMPWSRLCNVDELGTAC